MSVKYENPRHKCYARRNKALKKYTNYNNYHEYLNSEEWKEVREKVLQIKGRCCKYCNSTKNIQIHHLYYPKSCFTKKRITQLIPVCRNCHGEISKIERGEDMNPTQASSAWAKRVIDINGYLPIRKKRALSKRIIKSSGLPETLHHSIHSCIGRWGNMPTSKFIEKYELRKKQHPTIRDLYLQHKIDVIYYLNSLEKLSLSAPR